MGSLQHRHRSVERHARSCQRRHVFKHRDQRQRRRVERGTAGVRHRRHGSRTGSDAADDLGQPRDERGRRPELLVHTDHHGPERQDAHVLDQQSTVVGPLQHQHRPAERHAGGRQRRHLFKHRDQRQRRYIERVTAGLRHCRHSSRAGSRSSTT